MQRHLHKPLITEYEIPTISTEYFSPTAHRLPLPRELTPVERLHSQGSGVQPFVSNSDADYFETPNPCFSTFDDSQILRQQGGRQNKFMRQTIALEHSSSFTSNRLAQSFQSLRTSISSEHYSKPAPRTPYESETSDFENAELSDRIEVTLTPISNFKPNKISDKAYDIKRSRMTGLARKLVHLRRIDSIRKTIKAVATKQKERNTSHQGFYIKSALKKKTRSNELPSRKQSIRWKQPACDKRRFSCVGRLEKRPFYSEVLDASDIIMNNNVMEFGPVFLEDYN